MSVTLACLTSVTTLPVEENTCVCEETSMETVCSMCKKLVTNNNNNVFGIEVKLTT